MEQKKRKQIKTIATSLVQADVACEAFDNEVNEALREGWFLDKRYTLPSRHNGVHTVLIAELQRYVENE